MSKVSPCPFPLVLDHHMKLKLKNMADDKGISMTKLIKNMIEEGIVNESKRHPNTTHVDQIDQR